MPCQARKLPTNRERILLGDIVQRDAIELLSGIAGTAQAIITDPPYGIAYHSNYYKEKNPHAPIANDWNFDIRDFYAAAASALCDGGALYLFTRWDVYPLWALEIPKPLALKNLIIWNKDNWSSGDLTGNFGGKFECIMFLTKGRHQIRGHRWPNVWDFPRIPAKKLRMPAEKPVAIYSRAIAASSDEGGLVVDPFGGSGTLAEAAKLLERDYLAGDIDPKMVRMARERVRLPVEPLPDAKAPRCPIFNITPPNIADWGLHPEDIQFVRAAE